VNGLREFPFVLGNAGDFLAVFKPCGMHSVPVRGGGEGDLVSWLKTTIPSLLHDFDCDGQIEISDGIIPGERLSSARAELGMLSRLDRDTSGIVLFARSMRAFIDSFAMQRVLAIRKYYYLVTLPSGNPMQGSKPSRVPDFEPVSVLKTTHSGWITIESGFRSYGPRGSRVACLERKNNGEPGTTVTETVTETATAAGTAAEASARDIYRTSFRRREAVHFQGTVLPPDLGESALFLEAEIERGFRHQIRAHAAWAGMPIVGDSLYGGAEGERLYLEAHRVEIQLPGRETEVFELDGA